VAGVWIGSGRANVCSTRQSGSPTFRGTQTQPRRVSALLVFVCLEISAESEEADNGHAVLVGSDFAGARGEPSKNGL